MQGLVVYDSVYGNTEDVAIAIADEIKELGHHAELWVLKECGIPKKIDADFLFVGSPTRIHNMTRRAKKFIKELDPKGLGSRPILFFDTEFESVIAANGHSAAQRMHDLAKLRGLNAKEPVLKCGIVESQGPLSPDALDKARRYVRDFIGTLS